MGSRTTHAKRLERLAEVGVDRPEQLARLMSPIGLDLGARTPEETAISICAEIIARRTGRAAPSLRDAAGPDPRLSGRQPTLRGAADVVQPTGLPKRIELVRLLETKPTSTLRPVNGEWTMALSTPRYMHHVTRVVDEVAGLRPCSRVDAWRSSLICEPLWRRQRDAGLAPGERW